MTLQRADILLPVFAKDAQKMQAWSVVACDQYTSEADYWEAVSKTVGEQASTLRVTIPEIYLNDADIEARIQKANQTMEQYLEDGVFAEYKNTYVFVERTLACGAKRLGIVGMVDLEDYDYTVGSKTKIRATEGTVIERIPPRLKVRKDAPIELPHIMLLIDDESKSIIEPIANMTEQFEKLYDFDLMQNSGHITGYRMSDAAAQQLDKKLEELGDISAFNQKYGTGEATPLIYAMGDGNHSLATAKTYYENLKAELGEDAAKNSPARYALCELVNLHSDSLEFEAIHRVVFGADGNAFLQELGKKYTLSFDADAKGQQFVFVLGDEEKTVTVTNPEEYLTVATVQKALDEFLKNNSGEVDYIHGDDVVRKLCKDSKNFGIIFEAMDKADLYPSVIQDGALPRKTFSMGEACDKRFYTEARKIK